MEMEMEMENRKDIEDLFIEFDEENGAEFYTMVYKKFYATVVNSFRDEVEVYCKLVVFGNEYGLNTQELYNYDPYVAVKAWRDYVDRALEDFYGWAEYHIQDDLEDFISRFQQWLAKRDDERASNVIVALMVDEIDLNEIIEVWLCHRLGYEAWEYPM